MSSDDNQPEWVKNSVVLWEEDDSGTHDRERIQDAWLRLFGRFVPLKGHIEEWDGGDCFLFLHEGGRIAGSSCQGESIELTLDAAERYTLELDQTIGQMTRLKERLIRKIEEKRAKS